MSTGLSCPSCKVNLVMSDRQGIEIDYCPQCRGVWLDRGELDKIIERSASHMAPPAQVQPHVRASHKYDDDDYKYRSGGYYKKKNWLKEIFD